MGKWEDIVADYQHRQEDERNKGIDKEREAYDSLIDKLTKEECSEFSEERKIPAAISKLCTLEGNEFKSQSFGYRIVYRYYAIHWFKFATTGSMLYCKRYYQ